MRVISLLFLVFCCAWAQPIFPDGVAPILSSVNQRQASIKHPDKDDAAKLAKLEQSAGAGLQADLVEALVRPELAKVAYELVHLRVIKMKFLAGCPRDFSDCPQSWGQSKEGCVPPASYGGMCTTTDLQGVPMLLKEEFAWRCKADFPCSTPCAKDFSGCPNRWTNLGNGLCLAPSEYDGMCSVFTDFSSFSAASKGGWANRCGAPWCKKT